MYKMTKLKVYSATVLDVAKNDDGDLVVNVTGFVNSGGWTGVELNQHVNVIDDGVVKFDLIAYPPADDAIVPMAFEEVSASTTLKITDDLFKVVVYARTNSLEVELIDAQEADEGDKLPITNPGELTTDGGWWGFQGRNRYR